METMTESIVPIIQNVLGKLEKSFNLEAVVNRQAQINPALSDPNAGLEIALQSALNDVYETASPAVVRIETKTDSGASLGTGFIIVSTGYIITNEHVIHSAREITVKIPGGKSYQAKITGKNTDSDIAVLKIDEADLPTLPLGDSGSIEVGDFAIAIGNPFGFTSTFTFGVISATRQYVDTPDGASRIQTDVAINPGNSGGPLLNIAGEVIGINQMIASKSGGSEGIGFSIPVNLAREVIEELMFPGAAAYLGISARITQDSAGVLVEKLVQNSPAVAAGIQINDYILRMDETEINSVDDIYSFLSQTAPGKQHKVLLQRAGAEQTVSVQLSSSPSS